MSELKPCPFCGEHGYIARRGDYAIARCSNDCCDGVIGLNIDYTIEEAIEAWNKRADAPMLAEQNEKMLAMLKRVQMDKPGTFVQFLDDLNDLIAEIEGK